jgi:hypothetical protein
MGEWSEFFENFPENNPGNYVNGNFDPKGSEALRAAQAKPAQEQANLEAEIQSMIPKARHSDGGQKQ